MQMKPDGMKSANMTDKYMGTSYETNSASDRRTNN